MAGQKRFNVNQVQRPDPRDQGLPGYTPYGELPPSMQGLSMAMKSPGDIRRMQDPGGVQEGLMPGDLDIKKLQSTPESQGGYTYQSGPYSYSPSRNDIQANELQHVKQFLTQGGIEQGHKMQQLREPAQIKGGFDESVARISAQGGIDQQREASRGAMGVAGINADAQTSKAQQTLTALQTLLGAGGGALKPGQRLSVNGGGGFSINEPAQSQLPPALLQQVTGARMNLEKAKQGAGFWSNNESAIKLAQEGYDQALANVITRWPADPAQKIFVQNILRHPEYKDLDLDSILQREGQTDVTPDEYTSIQSMLQALRGK